jgi:hypothetical protein
MTNDINALVARLRGIRVDNVEIPTMMIEAADEIERLQPDAARWAKAQAAMCYSFDGERRTYYLRASGRESFQETVDRLAELPPEPEAPRVEHAEGRHKAIADRKQNLYDPRDPEDVKK